MDNTTNFVFNVYYLVDQDPKGIMEGSDMLLHDF